MNTKILGYTIFSKSKAELMNSIKSYSKIHIISGNPEILYNGLSDEVLLKNFTSESSIIIPDGVGTVIASKLVGTPVKEKIAGIEVLHEVLRSCERENKGVYLLGAEQSTLEECIDKLKIKYPGITIVGSHNGFFTVDNCDHIIGDIKESGAYALFVAMGSPRQEHFIIKYMDELPCSVYMGVGGSFDIIAGKLKRAPKWMINLGIEWLYRVIKEPYRITRLGSIPKFLVKVYFSR